MQGVGDLSEKQGIQIGFFNYAEAMEGLQIGIVNYAVLLKGLQIGVGNINTKGSIPFLPIINFSSGLGGE